MQLSAGILTSAFAFILCVPSAQAALLDPKKYNPVYVEKILEDWKVEENVSQLVAVTATNGMRHIAMLFQDGPTFRVYKNGKLLQERTVRYPQVPNLFRLTSDGQLLYYLEPYVLYLNGKRISTTTNTYAYNVGLQAEHLYRRGRVVFVDGQTIREYDRLSKRTSILYSHPYDIAYVRLSGLNVYYTAYDILPQPGYYLYRNGEKYDYTPIANPWNFAVTPRGVVYYFREGGSSCSLHKNSKAISSNRGSCGFVFADARANVLHVVALPEKDSTSGISATFHYNGKQISAPEVYNVEGWVALGRAKTYATRVLASPHDLKTFQLLKNGKLIGETFDFPPDYRDYEGVQFGPDGRTYMRNWKKDRWLLYEDGLPVHVNGFDQVYFVRAHSAKVTVIGTMPKYRR